MFTVYVCSLQVLNLAESSLQRKVALESSAENVTVTLFSCTAAFPAIRLTLHGLTVGSTMKNNIVNLAIPLI